jgi:hypothetical protein
VAYNHLDLRLVNFRSHTTKQWEVIHAKLDGLFYSDPHLKDRMVENYMKERLSLARNVWKRSWMANDEGLNAQTNAHNMFGNHLFGIITFQMHQKNQTECKGFMAMCGIPTHMVHIPCSMQFKLRSMLAMILIRIKFYITARFLLTILHVIPCTQVVKINYEVLICGQQNIIKMEACTNRQQRIT